MTTWSRKVRDSKIVTNWCNGKPERSFSVDSPFLIKKRRPRVGLFFSSPGMNTGTPEQGRAGPEDELDISSFCYAFRPCDHLIGLKNEDDNLCFVGKRLFYVDGTKEDPNHELNKKFLHAYLDHLDRNRVMLVEGAAGSGKSALVEEVAMLYISSRGKCDLVEQEGRQGKIYQGGYAIATNGTQTLTELRLFSYRDGLVNVLGPLGQMQKDAKGHPDRRYVFILHEYNRVTDFMSVLGNALESELRRYGPDSWFEGEKNKRHQAYSFGGGANETDRIKLPTNLKIVLTSNPPRDGFAGVVGDFMADGALKHNRLLGAKVKLPVDSETKKECSLERSPSLEGDELVVERALARNSFPCGAIVKNLVARNTSAEIKTLITQLIIQNPKVNPGKIVAEVRRRCKVLGGEDRRRQSAIPGQKRQRISSVDQSTLEETAWIKFNRVLRQQVSGDKLPDPKQLKQVIDGGSIPVEAGDDATTPAVLMSGFRRQELSPFEEAVLELLIENHHDLGINLDEKFSQDETVCLLAIQHHRAKLLEYLIKAGAKIGDNERNELKKQEAWQKTAGTGVPAGEERSLSITAMRNLLDQNEGHSSFKDRNN